MNSREKADEYLLKLLDGPCFSNNDVNRLAQFLDQHAEEAKAEQRQLCADAVYKQIQAYPESPTDLLLDACLDAGVEE